MPELFIKPPLSQVNLLGMNRDSLRSFFSSLGEKPFRSIQMLQWIHQRGSSNFSDMTNVSAKLRKYLSENCIIRSPKIIKEEVSSDGTRKWMMGVPGRNLIETVFIPEKSRGTLCISSQVGCALNCTFCSTARQGFNRNLSASEIIGQVWQACQRLKEVNQDLPYYKITNVVLMGMGEPMMNFNAVTEAMSIMRDAHAYGLPRRRVTLSTSGLVPKIDELSQVSDVALAVSLHAPNDELRSQLIPINKKYPIKELMEACKRYCRKNKRYKVTMEYVMLKGINDDIKYAYQLVKILKGVPCKVNLIPFNSFPGAPYTCSSKEDIQRFSQVLLKSGYICTTRLTRGDDINAACGQLVGEVIDRTRRSQKYAKTAVLEKNDQH